MFLKDVLEQNNNYKKDGLNEIIEEENVEESVAGDLPPKTHLPDDINPKIVTLFVVTQFFINLFVNIDMGILPAGSTKIKEELGIENTQFGFLGSIVYLG